ncbi:MAG: DUF2490 domain-containing protein [Proteobacteria bacterium]|nr:DUF2490 domain-containing protein [Pseudomonadota bacterium]
MEARSCRRCWLAAGLLALLSPGLAAAETTHSVESWLEAGLGHALPGRFSLALSTQLRLDEHLSRAKSLLPQVELGHRPADWLSFSGGYRFIYERDKRGAFEFGHRLFVDGQLSAKAAKLRLKYRLRFQDEWEWNRDGELQNRPTLRNLVGAKYRLTKRLRPTLSAEHFLALNLLASTPTRKWRLTLGPQLEVWKIELELYYRLEVESEAATTKLTHIIGLGGFLTPWSD